MALSSPSSSQSSESASALLLSLPPPLDSILNEELLLVVARFLPAQDLLRFQSVSKHFSKLDTDSIWRERCEERWQPWPRYRLTPQREEVLNTTAMPNTGWKQRYLVIERDATRNQLKLSDLQNSTWYLSFVLSGIRGEGRSDHMKVDFTRHPATGDPILMVPQYPPLPYEIMNQEPPTSSHNIRSTLRGDRPFSRSQWLRIANFPPHFVSRKASDAEWLIVNENVMMVSCAQDD